MQRVKGKVCIVTGAALGIGRACALRLAEEGARIALFDVLDDAGEALARRTARAAPARYWHVDVADERRCARAIDEVVAHFGAHATCWSTTPASPAPTSPRTRSPRRSGTGCRRSTSRACSSASSTPSRTCAAPAAAASSTCRRSTAWSARADVPPYHASKGAVRLMSKTDALLYAADRIRVNSVHPGFIWTPMVEHHLRDSGATDLEAARREVGAAAPARPHGRTRRHRLGRGVPGLRRIEVRHRLANW